LAEKTESFRRAEEELLNDAAAAYGEGFQDVVTQFTCAYLTQIPPSLMSPNAS